MYDSNGDALNCQPAPLLGANKMQLWHSCERVLIHHALAAQQAVTAQLLEALQLLTSLAGRGGPMVARALVDADVLGAAAQLWVLAASEGSVLQGLLSLLASLAPSGQAPAIFGRRNILAVWGAEKELIGM